jgi:hypothetical protein
LAGQEIGKDALSIGSRRISLAVGASELPEIIQNKIDRAIAGR